jgi:hypothetical protein
MGLGIAIAVSGVVDDVLACATGVEVNERMGSETTYQLRYPSDISDGDLPWLTEGKLDPGSELSVLVPVGEKMHCLVKGPVNSQNVHFEHGGAGSTLDVTGTDTSFKMDYQTKPVTWKDVTDSDVAQSILSSYGYTPDVDPTDSRHVEEKHALVQRESDLRFLRRLARRNGFQFWITCDAQSGVETAHFRRPKLDGEPEHELAINVPAPCLDSLDFTWDMERPTAVEGTQLDLNTLEDIDGAVDTSPQASLGGTGMSAIAPARQSLHFVTPVDDAGDLQARGKAALAESDWFLRGNCQTSLKRLGSLVRAHTLVAIVGAGSRYSGTYFVAGVSHSIDVTGHRMGIELVRNGWG